MRQIKRSECLKILFAVYAPKGTVDITLGDGAKFLLISDKDGKYYLSDSCIVSRDNHVKISNDEEVTLID